MRWRFLNATCRGTSHERLETPCQDDCLVDVIENGGAQVLIAVASDGAGSAACSEVGSGLVCELLLPAIEEWLTTGESISALDRTVVEQWICRIRSGIDSHAAKREAVRRDFACTLVVAIVEDDAAAFFQIGDGAIVVRGGGSLEVIFWPDGGEYANMTYFITDDDWVKHLHFAVRDAQFDDVALMTDGLQRLALRFESRSAHEPFFVPMFRALAAAPPGFASALEPPLIAFLGSDAVNARTDDDKTLVLATRREGVPDGAV